MNFTSSHRVGFFPGWITHHTKMFIKRSLATCTPLELWEINIFSRGQKVLNLEIRQIWDFQPRYTSSNMSFLCRGAKVDHCVSRHHQFSLIRDIYNILIRSSSTDTCHARSNAAVHVVMALHRTYRKHTDSTDVLTTSRSQRCYVRYHVSVCLVVLINI